MQNYSQHACRKRASSAARRYDGQLPGPTIYANQGVQTMLRLHNDINCSTYEPISNVSVFPTSRYYSSGNFADSTFGKRWEDANLALHLHGSGEQAQSVSGNQLRHASALCKRSLC